ncbi:TIGR04066 family peptide maturation system protein [Vallitalea maricola]|uniref:Uncharacterized protein n=1 Tax=Vallitalea maricola TaxID=3074433 RepID=A0ACB5UPX3_9FIRM|nr:hypothetical protein AN2V17_41450 [Vallitalea sp. AN17-2]
MKKRAAIYPYNSEFSFIVKHHDLLIDYDIVSLVSPIGFGLNNRDASYCYLGEDIGIKVTTSLFEKDFDDLIVCEYPCDFKEMILPTIETACEKGKNIVLLHRINIDLLDEVKKLCNNNNVNLKLYWGMDIDQNNITIKNSTIYEINVPVIFVSSVIEGTNKFDVQLCLRDHFLKEGYKVAQIGTKHYCELLGFHSFPRFMFNEKMNEIDKILLFNRLCKHIELRENPDLIIIGIPGSTMVYNNMFTNKFGMTAFQVANAVHPDVAVMNITYDNFNKEFLEKVFISTKYKLGFEIDCFNMSNNKFDTARSKQNRRLCYVTVNSNLVDKKISELNKELKIPIYNSLNKSNSHELAKWVNDILAIDSMQII